MSKSFDFSIFCVKRMNSNREKALTVDEIKWVFFQLKSVWAILISSYFNAEKKSKMKEKEKVKTRERKKKNQRDSSPWTRHTYPR